MDNVKSYLKLTTIVISSDFLKKKINNTVAIKEIVVLSNIRLLPEIRFWYLFLTTKQQPRVQKKKVKKKLKLFSKSYFLQNNLIKTKDIFEILWKIREVFLPIKEETDLIRSKTNFSKNSYLKLQNCTTTDETNELLLRTNVYIDNINFLLSVHKQEEFDEDYLYQLYGFPILKFFIKK